MAGEVRCRESHEAGEASPRRVLTGRAKRVLLAAVWLALQAAGAAGHPPDFPDLPPDLLEEDRTQLAERMDALRRQHEGWVRQAQQHNAAGCGRVEARSAQAAVCAERQARLLQEHAALHKALAALQAKVGEAKVQAALKRCLESIPGLTAQARQLERQMTALTQQLQRAEQAYAQAQGEERTTRGVEVARVREQVHDLTTRLEFLTYQVRILTTSPSQAASVCPGARSAPPARSEPPVPAPP